MNNIETTPTFSQVVREARRWPHGSPNHQRAMQALYDLYRSGNGNHCAGGGLCRWWDWVDTVEGSDFILAHLQYWHYSRSLGGSTYR